ncbi:MAG TPA: CAP domain-containing protein [Verrucomicrobiae bacterium]|nr:CAP domain-containing protein [Verrucomicrobiae bacterium]
MPKISRRTHTKDHTKRHGRHHKQSPKYAKVYAPYLPLVISIIASIFLSFWRPAPGNTLAYATEISAGGLLSTTNSQRTANGAGSLSLSGQLNSAAQAKANDMVARDYWSHTTPDGQQPWVFIDSTGYKYSKAGENLAYGFATSSETVSGWMNSPAHKANMLDTSFTQVGFGYANSADFNGDGEQTVVVAMYAKPQVQAATTPPAPSTTAPTATPKPPAAPAPVPTPSPTAPAEQPAAPVEQPKESAPVATDQPAAAVTTQPKKISRIEALTGGRLPWAATALGMLLIGLAVFKLLHHSLKFRHLLKDGERLILHHPLLDSTLLGLAILGMTLLRTVGTIL